MGKRSTAPGGWGLEAINLNRRQMLRVRRRQVLMGDGYYPMTPAGGIELEELLAWYGLGIKDFAPEPER